MSNMQFEYDPELLIQEIEKRPALWYVNDTGYRDKRVKAKLWQEIVKGLMNIGDDNKDISKAELRDLELQLQKKWKCLRDSFQKSLSNRRNFKKPYIYTEQLQFLLKDKEIPKRKAEARTGSESDEEPPSRKWKRKHKLNVASNHSEDDDIDYAGYDDMSIKPEPESDLTNVPNISQFAFANVEAHSKNDYEDADKMFLLSLLSDLKAIPEEFRLNVKVELMNVLKTAHENTSRLVNKRNTRCECND